MAVDWVTHWLLHLGRKPSQKKKNKFIFALHPMIALIIIA
ncbi:hypothetical protein MY10362_000105 [Beauveria mimosiformis]